MKKAAAILFVIAAFWQIAAGTIGGVNVAENMQASMQTRLAAANQ